jgi:protein-S-isoprenylcysteine O-methyltransferase Ste14
MALQEELEKQGIWLFRYRGTLPLLILFIGTILYLRMKYYPGTFVLEDTPWERPYEFVCLFVSLVGLGIRVYTVGHTPRNTSGRNVKEQVAETLNTTGIYSVVRHPLYLGNFFMWLGPGLLTGNLWFIVAFVFFYWIYYERIMFAEEQFLRRKFGTVFTDWSEKVPAFIPRFAHFVKSEWPFSWKKILKKEKNGLAAVFVVFTALNIAGEFIQHKTDYNFFFIVACIFSLVLYFILKYLKRRTNVLNEDGR